MISASGKAHLYFSLQANFTAFPHRKENALFNQFLGPTSHFIDMINLGDAEVFV